MGERASDESRKPGPGTARIVFSAGSLDAALTGTLPCVTCGYELKGLSIRNVCPECGTAVRATILYKVDPLAEEFRPIRHRRTVAVGLMAWSLGGLAAGLGCWVLRAMDFVPTVPITAAALPLISWLVVAAAAISGIGSLVLVRPTPATSLPHMAQALAGSLAYFPLVWAVWRMLLEIDPVRAAPYFSGPPQPDRIFMRFIASASIVVILLGVRPSARDLVKRSMVMRTGRVDRQTLLGMAVVSGIVMVGDALRLASGNVRWADPETVGIAGSVIIVIGSGLLTLGLIGAAVDSWRIARAVLIPSPSMRQVLGDSAGV
ncbi:MAG: hypothetical protein JNK58_01835 [Phycisphaerae bacterium]|nr:hypothetical protein [Phycisphaerae bacterium]